MLGNPNQSEVAVKEYVSDPGQAAPTSSRRILVVDDEPLILRLIERVLSIDGYTVDVAGDGQAAWLLLQEQRYDCIILDWRMPEITGKQLYEFIEGTFGELASKCLFISGIGHVTNAEVEEFASAHGNPILLKPFSIDQLQTAVSQLVEINQPQQ